MAKDTENSYILSFVESVHLNKKIPREKIFLCLEEAMAHAGYASSRTGDESPVTVRVDRSTGAINVYRDGLPLSENEIRDRVGATIVGQVLKQKIREAEQDMIYNEYLPLVNQLIEGEVVRSEKTLTVVNIGSIEAILPNSEKISRESFRPREKVCALVCEVKKNPKGVKVVLSRKRNLFVQRLCEQEIPEVKDGSIRIVRIERLPGVRSKVAVACDDPRIDVVGACVGVRSSRSRAITDYFGGGQAGERIDFVPWSDDVNELICNALKPAEVQPDDIILCHKLGRAIVQVDASQRRLAIGMKGQNVRLAALVCEWDLEVMTQDELQKSINSANEEFSTLPHITPLIAEALISEGFLTVDDLSIIEPSDFIDISGLTEEEVENAIAEAEKVSLENEDRRKAEQDAKRKAERVEREKKI